MSIFCYFKRRRRARLRAISFSVEWRRLIEHNVGLFRCLPSQDQAELLGHVQILLAEKHFEGCGGLNVTDEIRVTIAAHACILLLRRPSDYFPRLTSVLVYPSMYMARDQYHRGGGFSEEETSPRLGETQRQERALVLAWDVVCGEAKDPYGGYNLVIHEFAHQLDFENGATDGTPLLDTRKQYASWAKVFGREYSQLRQMLADRTPTIISEYAATNAAEFFAVATELFFERPRALHSKHPLLYDELRSYFRQDPAEYFDSHESQVSLS